MLSLILGPGIVYGVLNQLEIHIGLITKAIIAAPFGFNYHILFNNPFSHVPLPRYVDVYITTYHCRDAVLTVLRI